MGGMGEKIFGDVGKGFKFLLALGAVVGLVGGFSTWVEAEAASAAEKLAEKVETNWRVHESEHDATEATLRSIGAQMEWVAASQKVMLDIMAREERSQERRGEDR